MCENYKETTIQTSFAKVETVEQKVTLLGAAMLFHHSVESAMAEGNKEMVQACNFAAQTLEQIVAGTIPLPVFSDNEAVITEFESFENPVAKELAELDEQEEPHVLTK